MRGQRRYELATILAVMFAVILSGGGGQRQYDSPTSTFSTPTSCLMSSMQRI